MQQVTTQLEARNLANELKEPDREVLTKYSDALDVLRDKIMDVRGPNDLGPVYSSAQEILKLHDDIGDVVSKTAYISLF